MATNAPIRIGARGSTLSRRQVDEVRQALRTANPAIEVDTEFFVTSGDRQLDAPLPSIGGKGLFTNEIEEALREGRIDLAVHSLKDLPVENPAGIVIGAVLPRADVRDALISRSGVGLPALPPHAVLGTSSTRRAAQLRRVRSDLQPRSIRGNVETRLRKGMDADGEYDAIVLAEAGLARLGLRDRATQILPLELMLPAPGQAAIAVQCRDDAASLATARTIDHASTHLAVLAERAFLTGLGGGCSAPVAAYGEFTGAELHLHARVLDADGDRSTDLQSTTTCRDRTASLNAGAALAEEALRRGAMDLLGAAR